MSIADDMLVASLVGDDVERVAADAPLVEVARRLSDAEIGIVVVGDGERPLGVVSERDIVHAVAEGTDLSTATAAEVARTELAWVEPSASVHDVATEMMTNWVRHVLVGDADAMVGIVSMRDLLGAYAASAEDG